jgi:hypothetical protein
MDGKMTNQNSHQGNQTSMKKILFALLPFWDPLIPPQGIACLKSYLQRYGYNVKTVAANKEGRFLVLYDRYFKIIKDKLPVEKHEQLFHLGHFVLQNHMMAHINYEDDKNNSEKKPDEKFGEHEYRELIKDLVYKNYYMTVETELIVQLDEIITEFYRELESYIIELVEREKPGVLGISVYKATLPATYYVFKLVRQKYPAIKTIMGGGVFADHLAIGSPNFELFLEKTKGSLDHLFIGQGEKLVLKYLQGELPPEQRVYTREDTGGQTLDFAELDIPDYSDYDVRRNKFFALGATGSISCKYQCSFCNEVLFFGKYRKKKPTQTVREMITLSKKYGYQLFFMTDSMLNPIATQLAQKIIDEDEYLYYDSYFRVEPGSDDIENTTLWRQGGFYRARLGVESGSQHVLDLIKKGISPQQIKATVSALAYAGTKTTTYWVIGHPGETEDDFRQTLELVTQLKDDIWQAECAPFDYYYSGQTFSDQWADKRRLLYSEKAKDLLIAQTWILDCQPNREEIYDRVFRFVEHCGKLGIPNPYSLSDIYKADERWKKLHPNAVPSMLDFQKKGIRITEKRKIQKKSEVREQWKDEEDFVF